jgi:hypothetical protein
LRVSRQRAQREKSYEEQCHVQTHATMVRSLPECAPRARSQYVTRPAYGRRHLVARERPPRCSCTSIFR